MNSGAGQNSGAADWIDLKVEIISVFLFKGPVGKRTVNCWTDTAKRHFRDQKNYLSQRNYHF